MANFNQLSIAGDYRWKNTWGTTISYEQISKYLFLLQESSGIEENLSLLDSLREPHVYKPFILCVIMALAFQLSATSAISFYNIQMFTNTGKSGG